MSSRIYIIVLIFIFYLSGLSAQAIDSTPTEVDVDSSLIYKKRLKYAIGLQGGSYLTGMTGLSILWYKDYPSSPFHFFNDNAGWHYIDKVGHFTTAYYTGLLSINTLKWANVDRKKAVWYGGCYGLLLLTSVEMLDGISAEWGASPIDLISNFSGAAFLIGQELGWREQRITIKFSYHNSPYAKYRPDKLGSSWKESWLKDYNGQTYWLSANIKTFLPSSSRVPKWLNFAFGYGADGMITGYGVQKADYNNQTIFFNDHKQFYLAPDIDLTKIKTKSGILNTLFKTFGWIKFPLPTVEYNKVEGVVWHWLYF